MHENQYKLQEKTFFVLYTRNTFISMSDSKKKMTKTRYSDGKKQCKIMWDTFAWKMSWADKGANT